MPTVEGSATKWVQRPAAEQANAGRAARPPLISLVSLSSSREVREPRFIAKPEHWVHVCPPSRDKARVETRDSRGGGEEHGPGRRAGKVRSPRRSAHPALPASRAALVRLKAERAMSASGVHARPK